MLFLKQSTASQSILLGPFVDATDGATAETGLTIANTDIRLSKNGGNMAAKNSGGGTHDENGWYTITLDATDTNTVGRLQISCKVSGALAVFMECQVLEEDIYDALIGASAAGFDSNQRVDVGSWLGTAVTVSSTSAKPEVDVYSVSDDATAANNVELDYDGTGYNKSNSTIGTCTTNTDMRGTDSALLASSAPTNFSDLSITATTGRVDVASIEGSDATDQINAACDTALSDYDAPTKAEVDAAFTEIKGATWSSSTDTLEAIRDRGDAEWVTATGFSTHSAADVWSVATRVLTASTNFNDISDSDVNAQVLDVLNTDTFPEPSSVPAATATLVDKIGWLTALSRNKFTQTSTTQTLRNDADSGDIATSTHSDGSGTYTRGEWS